MKYNESRNVCLNTVIADGKPHKMVYDMIADEADVAPMKLLYPSTAASGYFDLCPDNYGGADGQGFIYIGEIPADDGTTRAPFDKTTAYGTADVAKFNGYRLEKGRHYHVTSGDLTAQVEGLILKCGADGIVDEPAVPANTTPDTTGFGFTLIKGVSTTESIVEFLGLIHYDDSA
ncbi:hypothetical protein [Candidatus Lokiarchaeum ossiferum]|uniref:hypothetical protein n=1 Tax=Candidatus Lokiarchaeum ossiferum TaxID=2951803 RepID=UPI00352C0480